MRRSFLLLSIVAAASTAARGQSIPARLAASLTRIQDVLAESFARSLPLPSAAADQTARGGKAPLFGMSSERPDYYDFSIGGRGALWRDTLFAFVNVAIPLNDGFVRTDPIPLVGLEGTF